MILLTKKKDKSEEALLVAETQEDLKVIHYLYDKSILFGAYKIYDKTGDKSHSGQEYQWLIKNFPLAMGILFISIVERYAK